MLKNESVKYEWDPDAGRAMCIINDGKRTYVGAAWCDPQDLDMMSEKTGCFIAETRALINYWKTLRNEQRIILKAYKDIYNSISQSNKYNPNSYEAKQLNKYIWLTEQDLNFYRNEIKALNQTLTKFIADKDLSYRKIRDLRSREGQK